MRRTGAEVDSSLAISELYVPRTLLALFLREAGKILRSGGVPMVYGTVRLIEQDNESFLAWAKEPYACVIFNLLTEHTQAGRAASRAVFLELIDLATALGGSFYLTYHRFAERRRVEGCYPNFGTFLRRKEEYDPGARFQSDWWRQYRD